MIEEYSALANGPWTAADDAERGQMSANGSPTAADCGDRMDDKSQQVKNNMAGAAEPEGDWLARLVLDEDDPLNRLVLDDELPYAAKESQQVQDKERQTVDALASAIMKNAIERGTNGVLVMDSRKIAEMFGKRHDHVLRDIANIIRDTPEAAPNFGGSNYIGDNGKSLPCIKANRDGFMLLGMGFTGAVAGRWKLAVIRAFNMMEAKLREIAAPTQAPGNFVNLSDPNAVRLALLETANKLHEVKAHNKELYEMGAELAVQNYGMRKRRTHDARAISQLKYVVGDYPHAGMPLEDTAGMVNAMFHQQGVFYIFRDIKEIVGVEPWPTDTHTNKIVPPLGWVDWSRPPDSRIMPHALNKVLRYSGERGFGDLIRIFITPLGLSALVGWVEANIAAKRAESDA